MMRPDEEPLEPFLADDNNDDDDDEAPFGMHPSDSLLSTDSSIHLVHHGDDTNDEAIELHSPSRHNDHTDANHQSALYMEQASMEAQLLPMTIGCERPSPVQVWPAGRLGRRRTSASESEVILASLGAGDDDEMRTSHKSTESESAASGSGVVRTMVTDVSNHNSIESSGCSMPGTTGNNHAAATKSSSNHGPPNRSTHGSSIMALLQAGGILHSTNNNDDKDNADDSPLHALQCLFENFCVPAVPLSTLAGVLQEQQQQATSSNQQHAAAAAAAVSSLEWPDPVTVVLLNNNNNTSSPQTKVVALLTHPDHLLLQLPPFFTTAFLRILIRLLLVHDDDTDSNDDRVVDQQQQQRIVHLMPDAPKHATAWSPVVYNVARLQCTAARQHNDKNNNNNHDEPLLVHAVLDLLQKADQQPEQSQQPPPPPQSQQQQQQTPVHHRPQRRVLPRLLARLLGLVAAAGVSPRSLRRMMQFITQTLHHPTTRLAVLQALETATWVAASTAPSPNHFFCLGGHATGLTRTLTGLPSWPFRNDFGMALWFRAERFGRGTDDDDDLNNNNNNNPILLSARSDNGGGIQVSLERISSTGAEACTIAVSIFDSSDNNKNNNNNSQKDRPVQHLIVRGCVLLPRVWYHVAIRHTRSRLKGVFSLSMRQQLSILIDGKIMLTEPLAFPKISQADFRDESSSTLLGSTLRRNMSTTHSRLNLNLCFGAGLDGETGAMYIFNESVSDASFRALYEATGGKRSNAGVRRHSNAGDVWDARRSDIVRMSRILDVKMTNDDAEEIVLSHRGVKSKKRVRAEKFMVMDVAAGDGEETEDADLPVDLQRASFASKVFVALDPKRVVGSTALELNAGAHVNVENVYSWSVHGAQDVIGSLGGIQALIPVFRSFLSSDGEHAISLALANDKTDSGGLEHQPVSFVLPALLDLLSAFVQNHSGNSRELLRCGGIDVIADLLVGSKRMLNAKTRTKPSLFGTVSSCIGLSSRLVESLVRLESSCSPNVALETKVFSRLLLNAPLWLDARARIEGDALQSVLFPVLSAMTRIGPERVRDCVGVKDMVHALREVLVNIGAGNEKQSITTEEITEDRLEVAEVILGMIFTVLAVGTTTEHLSPFLHFIVSSIEAGWTNARSGQREITMRACTVLVFLLQIRPAVSGLFESFAECSGSIQSGVGWMLCSMVNSSDDEIRSLGIRAIASYLEVTSHGNDAALSLGSSIPQAKDSDQHNGSDVASNVMRASNRIGRLAKGLAAMGPSTRAVSLSLTTARLTPSVVYKLLWHFLKNHRYHLSDYTHTALLSLISDDNGVLSSSLSDFAFLKDNLIGPTKTKQPGFRLCTSWAQATLAQTGHIVAKSLRNPLAIGTVLRLLRFFDDQQKDKWLKDLLDFCNSSRKCISLLASLPDWQPSLFQLISDTLESVRSNSVGETAFYENANLEQSGENIVGRSTHEWSRAGAEQRRLDICLDLFSLSLGHLLREGGEKALEAVEMTASLQRTCVNGTDVLLMILSSFCSDIFDHGTILEMGSISAEDWKDIDLEEDSLLLKQSAKRVTDAILSQGTKGLDMPAAVRSWRSLRHLTELIVAVATKSGLGVVDLFDYTNHQASAVDGGSGGLFGIRLADGRLTEVKASEYARFTSGVGDRLTLHDATPMTNEAGRDVDRRLCVALAAQILVLLDAFVFPESLDTSLPASQLDGLALVRNSEARLGSSQGPLVSSAMRLSFVLLALLEPCSVKFLQCASRLRCLLGWALELVRESSNEGQPEAFSERTSHIDRLLLAIVLHCHRALGRCAALLTEIESSSCEKYFASRDAQKKQQRRLLRSALELRDVVSTTFRGRNEVLRSTLSTEAYEALRSSLEGQPSSQIKSQSKESVVRDFLSSKWVDGFQDIETRYELVIPEQVSMETIPIEGEDAETAIQGLLAIESLAQESKVIIADFEKALDSCFKNYLEAQRKWTETDAVRELEYDGDTTLKRLSEKQRSDCSDIIKEAALRRSRAEHRWNAIEQKTVKPWGEHLHWKLPSCTDPVGRRLVLVENPEFDRHSAASYELALGLEQQKENAARQSRLLQKERLSEVMRRNAEAFAVRESPDEGDGEGNDDDSLLHQASDGESSTGVDDSLKEKESASVDTAEETAEETVFELENDEGWDQITPDEVDDVDAEGDVDGWARQFIWSETESVVARFEPVMVVSLQTYAEGKLLLSTHGLYFLQTTAEVSVMTNEVVGADESGTFEKRGRRWRLSRLTEVHGRRYMLRPQAIELYFSNCHELLLNFPSGAKERDRFHAKLRNSCRVPMLWSPKSLNPRTVFRKSNMTELWKKRKISTFEYLMAVNRMAGRSCNDLTQYPVFPWVLADYTSETINLNDSRVYRDLTKPVGALNPDRLAQLIERYKDLELFGFTEAEKFLYGSHYSSPGIVLHYLIRQEPITTMAIALQSGRFDCPDRLFFDVASSWNGCLTSTSDMKELVPEFFYLPEMFLNSNDFPLGRTQTGRLVHNVGLPPWAKGSAHEFVRINRLALESEYVSRNIHHWIDLIFGYKQRGPESEAAHNIFHHLSYEGSVDLDKITDEVDRKAAETHIQNFGQTPSQLSVVEPHPARYPLEDCWQPLIYNSSIASHLRCQTPSKQFANNRSEYAKGSVLKLFVLPDTVLAVYADLSIGTYRWQPSNKHNRLRMDKLRPLSRRELGTSRGAIKRGSAIPAGMMDSSKYAIGSSSFSITIGGLAKEEQRRKAAMPSHMLLSSSESGPVTSEASAMIVSCGYWDDAVKIHAADTFRVLASGTGGHRGPVRCLSVGDDGGVMVTGGQDGTARVWVVGHHSLAMALADGYVQTALGASSDGEHLMKCCHVLWGHDCPVVCVDLNWELDIALSGSQVGRVCVHTIRRGEFVRTFEPPALPHSGNAGSVSKLVLGSTGVIVVHMEDKGLHCFTANGARLCSTDAGEHLNDMAICSFDQILVSGGDRCQVLVRTVVDLQVYSILDLSRHGPIRCLSLTPADLNPVEQFLFVGSDDGMISIVDQDPVSKGKELEAIIF